MATSKDVFDQIRDLQSFIDDLVADSSSNNNYEHDEKTEVLISPTSTASSDMIITPTTSERYEKIQVEEEKEKEGIKEEKALVETDGPPSLSILDYKLNLSDDFSSLVSQFKELQVSPTDEKKPMVVKKEQLDPILVAVTDSPLFPSNNNSSGNLSPLDLKPRRGSISSKKSQKSTKSTKSFKSARRQVNKQTPTKKDKPKYISRRYDEMMRIPDIFERISFYEKTLDLCMKTDSPISQWTKSIQSKGKPYILTDGYTKNLLLSGSTTSLLFSPDDTNNKSTASFSSTLSDSISTFLKKATSSTQSLQQPYPFQQPNNRANVINAGTPHITNNSGLFSRSISKFHLSRSTPKSDHRNQMNSTRIPFDKKLQSPLVGQMKTINPSAKNDSLHYMSNILPQIDIKTLQLALDEAKGDPMLAISIAVSKSKNLSPVDNNTNTNSNHNNNKKSHMKKFKV